MTNIDLYCVIFVGLILYVFSRAYKCLIRPKILDMTTKEFDKNPKWITNELHSNHYGFDDIDFIPAENFLGTLPRFRVSKSDKTRLEILFPNDTSTKDVEQIGRIALVGKIKIKYGLFFPDKPLHWLSILLFMLEGGDVTIKDISKDKKPIDDFQKI